MRRIFLFVLLFVGVAAMAQQRQNATALSYIAQYKDVAIMQMLRYNIPASITLAQGLIESGSGTSELATKGNNHFGIKCHDWTGRTTYHDDDERNECFRAYDNAYESFEDHSRFLATKSRYASLFQLPTTDYKAWAQGLKACGYATSPTYAQQLIGIIELYELYQYDTATKYDRSLAAQTKHSSGKASASSAASSSASSSAAQPLTGHTIYAYNNCLYVRAVAGDTFRSIAHEAGLHYKRLARNNERHHNSTLNSGDIVYLTRKQKRADSNEPAWHTVAAGESLYTISQRYAIRLSALYRLNRLSPAATISVGDRLRVR